MGIDDKVSDASEDAAGKLKRGAGEVTGDEQVQTEGKTDQAGADIKQAGEKAKDAFKA